MRTHAYWHFLSRLGIHLLLYHKCTGNFSKLKSFQELTFIKCLLFIENIIKYKWNPKSFKEICRPMQRNTNLVWKPKWNLQGEQWQKSPNSYKLILTYEKRTFRSYIVLSTGTSFAKLGRKPTRIRTMTKKEYASLLNLQLPWMLCKQLMSLHGHPPGLVSGIYILIGVINWSILVFWLFFLL